MLPSTGTYMYFVPSFLSPFCTCIGSGWASHIGSALDNSKGFIAVITSNYIKSDYCTKQLKMARRRKMNIFPVIHEEVDYTQSENMSGVELVIQGIKFPPNAPNYTYSQSLALLEYKLTAYGKQCVPSTAVHLKHPLLFSLVFFHCFVLCSYMYMHIVNLCLCNSIFLVSFLNSKQKHLYMQRWICWF